MPPGKRIVRPNLETLRRYNDKQRIAPEHEFPQTDSINLASNPGAATRVKLEEAFSRFGGISYKEIEELGVTPQDLARYQPQVRSALLAMLNETPQARFGNQREAAVAFLGEFGMKEDLPTIVGLLQNHETSSTIRAAAVECLARLKDERAKPALLAASRDEDPRVRSVALRLLTKGKSRPFVVAGRKSVAYKRNGHDETNQRTTKRFNAEPVEAPFQPIQPSQGAPTKGPAVKSRFGGGSLWVSPAYVADQEIAPEPPVTGYEILAADAKNVTLRLHGKQALELVQRRRTQRSTRPTPQVNFDRAQLKPGQPLPMEYPAWIGAAQKPVWIPDAPIPARIESLASTATPQRKGQPFGVTVRFSTPRGAPPIIRLDTTLPGGVSRTTWHRVSADEGRKGQTTIEGFRGNLSGLGGVTATLYASNGATACAHLPLQILPTNPQSMNVWPKVAGSNGEGPARYKSDEDRFYCYGRFEVANGNSFPISVGPKIVCQVTDGGDFVETFTFNIATSTVPANSVGNIPFYVYFGDGTDTYDIFKDFGDVKMQFLASSSQGVLNDSNVWAAMAKTKVAFVFVGNIPTLDKVRWSYTALNEASGILEQQGLYIVDAPRYGIPSDHWHYGKYRQIWLEEAKSGCSSVTSDEADDMREAWSSSSSLTKHVDVFVTEGFNGSPCAQNVLGFSPVDGPTDKTDDDSGVVIKHQGVTLTTASGRRNAGLTLAHELGHYFGLEHDKSDNTNFMAPTNNNGNNTKIRHGQYLEMTEHDLVRRHDPTW